MTACARNTSRVCVSWRIVWRSTEKRRRPSGIGRLLPSSVVVMMLDAECAERCPGRVGVLIPTNESPSSSESSAMPPSASSAIIAPSTVHSSQSTSSLGSWRILGRSESYRLSHRDSRYWLVHESGQPGDKRATH